MRTRFAIAGSLSAALVLASSVAWGHSVLVSPTPRDTTCDGPDCKMAPCGGKSAGPIVATYPSVSAIPVQWNETIDHTGCFVLEISKTGMDNDFIPLRVQKDGTNNVPMMRDAGLALDGGFDCQFCTLRLRQIMNGDPNNCGPTTDAGPTGTYYSCADIQIGTWPDGGTRPDAGSGGGTGDAGGGGGGGGGGSADGGGGVDGGGAAADPGDEAFPPSGSGGGCSTAPGSAGLFGFAGIGIVLGLAAARRRRSKK